MAQMVDCPDADFLKCFMLGQVTGPAAKDLEAHLKTCEKCQRALDTLDDVASSGRRSAEAETQDHNPAAAGQSPTTIGLSGDPSRTPSYPGWPVVPGYELLKELGRGGMGVVYQARQVALKRLVALKMILSGAHAGPVEQERFRREAEAVALIEHPNIVQIHEVGEHDGLPYLCLEFVPGGSLDQKLATGPMSASEAVRLVEVLARAMQAAHEHGIIHRDLKPGNVLLAAAGSPKITDFGLAKRLAEAGQTVSGQIMGTPSYMAPEQAAGQIKALGPATDVYALGAILYELLTGRPPFRADNMLDTLEQVRSQEPAGPRSLVPGLPRDLETICLKCLRKAPGERYVSAAALADDLTRFRQGEPIRARRAGWVERTWKWLRRRPTRAALIGLSLLVAALSLAVIVIRQQAEEADRQKHAAELVQTCHASLEAAAWDPEHVKRLDAMLLELEELDPTQATALRDRLPTRLAEVTRESFSFARLPVLGPDHVPAIEALLRLLDQRAPALARTVRQEFQDRQRAMQLVLDLKYPFAAALALFPDRLFETKNQSLILKPKGKHNPLLLTERRCTRNVEIEAVFEHPDWNFTGPIGLVLQGAEQRGYRFTVEVADTPGEEPGSGKEPRFFFADALRWQGALGLRIHRNELRLREAEVPIDKIWAPADKDRRLRLWAKQAGERLTFQCNGVKIDFEDGLPLYGNRAGVFGLLMPAQARLVSLRAWAQDVPASPSPLERGDELFVVSKFSEARTEYQLQARTGREPAVREQASYKEALCYLAERDEGRAAELFESLAREATVERWQVLSLCQLWGIRLGQGNEKEADLIFQTLYPRYRGSQAALFLPDHVRQNILAHYRWSNTGVKHLLGRYSTVPLRERAVQVEEFLQSPVSQRLFTRFHLFRAYLRSGRLEEAQERALELLRDAPLPDRQHQAWWFDFWEDYGYLMRAQKQAMVALTSLDKCLYQKPGVHRPECLPLLVERASLLTSLNRPDEAESSLNTFFAELTRKNVPGRYWARACLMLGLLCQNRNDETAALTAWRQGLFTDPSKAWTIDRSSPIMLAEHLILAVFCKELTDAEVDHMTRRFLAQMGGYIKDSGIMDTLRAFLPELAPEIVGPVLRAMWQTPEGRRLARQIAFRELASIEMYQTVASYATVCLVERLLEPAKLSAEQKALARKLVEDLYAAFIEGKLRQRQLLALMQLAAPWRNQPSFFGWDIPARAFDPPLRGAMAYFVGLRQLHVFRNAKEARAYFQRALQAAPPRSQLQTLASEELRKLNEKK